MSRQSQPAARGALSEPRGPLRGVRVLIAYTDYATATMAALATVAALLARDAHAAGRGQRVQTSLLASAFTMQAGSLIGYPGRPPDPPGGRDVRGTSVPRRAYRLADGWLFVAAEGGAERAALLAALGLAGHAALREPGDAEGADHLASAVAGAFRDLALGTTLERLRAGGVPAVACPVFPDIVRDEQMRANGYWWESRHPDLGDVVQTGEVVKLSATPMRLGPVAPRLGEHGVALLREIGFDETRIARLLESGAVIRPRA